MRSSWRWVLSLSVVPLSASGCHRNVHQRPAREPRVEEVGTRATRSAVNAIAEARCDREERCRNIGADAKFASKSGCLERVHAEWADELNARDCPGGVREIELDECLEDIRDEDCNNPFDSLERMLSCGTAEICER